jgi:hypothetical protein
MCYGKKIKKPISCWKTKDGRIQTVSSMDEDHVRNTLSLLIRVLGNDNNNCKVLSQEILFSKLNDADYDIIEPNSGEVMSSNSYIRNNFHDYCDATESDIY